MNRVLKKLLFVSGVTLLALSITSCGSESDKGGSKSGIKDSAGLNDTFKNISQEEVDSALKDAKILKDEFIGNYEIFFIPNEKTLTKVEDSYIGLSIDITRKDEKSDWEFTLVSAYNGKGWMFHDEVNIKSPNGIINFSDMISSSEQVQDGGSVSELSYHVLSKKEIQEFCSILDSNEVKFRLRGERGKVLEQSGQMKEFSVINNRNLCTVYFGLEQGLIVTK